MSQFIVSKYVEFDAGHRVPLHASKCRNPHGHRYKVVAYVAGDLQEEGSSTGMVMDFSDIKMYLTNVIHDKYDHGFIIHINDQEMLEQFGVFRTNVNGKGEYVPGPATNDYNYKIILVDWTPTAEEMARSVYNDLIGFIPGLVSIDVFETPTSCASYPYRSNS